jgi:hypothetical protein
LTLVLTPEEILYLRSLSESLQGEFLETLPEDELLSVLDQLRSATVVEPAANFAEDRSARNAQAINAKTAAAQEIGPLPAVKDLDRRAKASVNNLLFAETYFPATFYLPWAPYQRAMMNRFQEIVLSGGRECHAVRRGGLKSTCARVSTLWAVVNGHRRFPVLVGATDDKADEHRENFFALMASSATHPEVATTETPVPARWQAADCAS